MPNYTNNLNLEKPLQGEFYDVDIFNSNYDKIDTAIGDIPTNSYQKPTGGIPLSDVSSQITDRLDWYGTTTGGINLVLNIPEFVGTLKAGTVLRFRTGSGGTGSFTLNFNGNGAKRINRSNGSQLNRVDAGGIYTVVYDGSNFILQGEGGEYGNATANDVLAGRTIGTENGLVGGTIQNRGIFNLGLGVVVPPGYYSGGTTANGKNFLFGTVNTSTLDGKSTFMVSNIGFVPSYISLEFSYNSTNYLKVYNSNSFFDVFSITRDNVPSNTGPWEIFPTYVRTNVTNTNIGSVPITYKIFS